MDVFFAVARVLAQSRRPDGLTLAAAQLRLVLVLAQPERCIQTDGGDTAWFLLLQAAVEQRCVCEVLSQLEVFFAALGQPVESLDEAVRRGERYRELQVVENLVLHLNDLLLADRVVRDPEQILKFRWINFLVLASDV